MLEKDRNDSQLYQYTSFKALECMDMTIRRYHEDMKRLQDESNRIGI